MGKAETATPIGSTAFVTVTLCTLVAVFEGFDLQSAGVVAPRLAPVFHMTPAELGWFFSASTFGLVLGAAIGGRLSDLMGRKGVLILSTAVFGLLSVGTALATSAEGLLACRFLTGVGLGGALPNLIALVAENVRDERGATSIGLLYAGLPAGGALASLVTVFGSDDWRLVFLVGGLAPLATIPLLVRFLPDSPKLSELRGTGGGPRRPGVGEALFGSGRAVRTAVLWGGFFCALLTMYLLLNWLPSLLVSRGLTRPQASMVQVAFNLLGALGSIATGMLTDRLPRRLAIVGVFAASAGSLVLLASIPPVFGLSVMAGGLVGGAVLGAQSIYYALAPRLYPTTVRGAGVGFAVAVGRLGSAVGPLLAAALLGSGRSPSQVLLVLLPIISVAGLGAFVLAPNEPARTSTRR